MQLRTSVRGIPVLVDPSSYVTLMVVAATATVLLHQLSPGVPPAALALLGAFVGLAVLASLLWHELAHAWASHRAGVEVEHIRMFAGGALCLRKQHLQAARDQFEVAVAGPLASTVLGLAALAIAIAADMAGAPAAVSAACWFVAIANLLVAFSNMLPIFPFDGGKAVHAMFWRRTGDRRAATSRLHRSGREFARVVIALGIVMIAGGGDFVTGLASSAFGLYLLRLPEPPG